MYQLTLFFVLAVISVVSALLVVFNKNVIHSALFLLINFCTLAGFYFMLNAQFLAVVQILVYAGAIVVLFLFVVMLLGVDLGEQINQWINQRNLAMLGLSLILLTLVGASVQYTTGDAYNVQGARGDLTVEAVQEYGQAQLIGVALLTDYMLSVQLAGVLLLVGIVGVVWLTGRDRPGADIFDEVE